MGRTEPNPNRTIAKLDISTRILDSGTKNKISTLSHLLFHSMFTTPPHRNPLSASMVQRTHVVPNITNARKLLDATVTISISRETTPYPIIQRQIMQQITRQTRHQESLLSALSHLYSLSLLQPLLYVITLSN
ncbi:unnamed protein product [Lactuca saligna]|uniref:Uncharacterized protein n=1 Tax=Lactuca saligna TaxID=75948 RepID=A0AA35VGV2_LACSI|nr:unnamed protein product [Lactuca saligna]